MQRIAVLLTLLLLPFTSLAEPLRYDSGGYQYDVDSTPTWVKEQAVPLVPGVTDATSGPTRLRLIDQQVLLTEQGTTLFRRLVWKVINQAGIDSLSNLVVGFIPEYQKLVIHEVVVTRNGKRGSRLDPASVRLVPNEHNMDRRIYRGSVVASIFVKDIRVGDDVEFSLSIQGVNPVFENRLSLLFPLAVSAPVDAIRLRLHATTGKNYQTRVLNSTAQPLEKSGSGFVETSVSLDNIPAYVPEDESSRRSLYPMIQFGEFRDWQEVASWAGRLFDVPNALPAELRARMEAWRKQTGSQREAARLAVEYVQREIAYISVSIGENSHRPASPENVFKRGFGDCKDKALLLSVLLRELGMNAYPALVSREFGGAIAEMLPGTYAFDHAVTVLDLDGETYWLDGTAQFQAGPLSERFAGSFGSALAVGRQAPSLVAVSPPLGYSTRYESTHRYRIAAFAQPVELILEGTYSGSFADATRNYIQSSGREQFEKWFDDGIRRIFPTMERRGAIDVRDDQSGNSLSFRGEVLLSDFFSRNNGQLEARVTPPSLLALLHTVESNGRKSPVRLVHPQSINQTIIVEFPEDIPIATLEPVVLQNDYRSFRMEQRYQDRRLTLVFHYETRRDEIPESQVQADNDLVRRMQRRSVVSFAVPITATPPSSFVRDYDRKSTLSIAELIDDENLRQLERVTAEIQSGRLSRKQLVRAYVERAWKLERLERFNEAIEDIGHALDIDPGDGDALETRAADLSSLRRFDEALEAYRIAEQKLPDSKELLYGRGRMYYYLGKYAEAEQDFRRALGVAKSSDQSYYLAWLYMAAVRSGRDGRSEIESYLSGSSRSEWPGPVIRLFLGGLAPEDVVAIAKRTDERTAVLQLCEAQFFIGQHHLLKGQVDKAILAFQEARATGVRQYIEYQYASWELEALAGRKP